MSGKLVISKGEESKYPNLNRKLTDVNIQFDQSPSQYEKIDKQRVQAPIQKWYWTRTTKGKRLESRYYNKLKNEL